MKRFPPQRPRVGVILLALLAAGCVGQSPRVAYYTLAPVAEPGAAVPTAIAVGPVDFPRALERSQIATRLGPNRLEYDEFHRWAGNLDEDFLNVAAVNLGRLLATDRVVVYPAAPAFAVDYRVLFDVIRFDADSAGNVSLEARWVLHDGRGETLDVGVVRTTRSAPADDYAARAAAQSDALGELCRTVAGRIRALHDGAR